MGRYPAQPLAEKEAWMRAKQENKHEREHKRKQHELAAIPAPREAGLPQMLRVNQVAKLLGVSAKTVRGWFRRRAVVVPGGSREIMLIPQRALDDWIREHTAS